MKIALFGGTGATGHEIIRQALERNDQITALVRNPAGIQQTSADLEVITGNLFDTAAVEQVISGKDAVLSVLGFRRGDSAPAIYRESAQALTAAMSKTGVKRLIYCTSAGTEDHDPNELWFYTHIYKPLFLQKSYDDMKLGEALIRASDLDWILVRPSRLTDVPGTEQFRVSPRYRPKGGVSISRADLAYFMLQQITSGEWLHQTPTLGY